VEQRILSYQLREGPRQITTLLAPEGWGRRASGRRGSAVKKKIAITVALSRDGRVHIHE